MPALQQIVAMTPSAELVGQPELAIEPSSLALICGAVAFVWVLIAGILVLVSRTRRATLALRCPMLRRDVTVESNEWDGRMLDVRRCSGLHPPDDFELCGKNCLDLDESIPATNGAGARSPRP